MIAVTLTALFLALGAFAGMKILPGKDRFTSAYLGMMIGLTALIWLPVLCAAITGRFTASCYAAASVVYLIGAAAIWFFSRRKRGSRKTLLPPKSFWIVGAFFLILMGVLFYTHVLMPKGGDLYVGQCTYGDLSMHLGFITSLAEQGTFPPQYNLFPGVRLSYPFLIDGLSSGMLLLGLPLSWAVIFPSLICCALLYTGLYLLFREMAGTHSRSMFSLLLFFLCGGLGVFYFLDGSAADPFNFTRIFTEYYNAPTNFPEYGLRWVNPICDMILPQRTTLMGWTMIPAVFLCVLKGLKDKDPKWMLTGGILAGAMPMMHTHSYLACGIVCMGWVISYAPWRSPKEWIPYLLRWAAFGIPALALAFPQLFAWTFRQAVGDSFVREGLDWVNEGDPSWWFWLKNLGLAGLLFLPSLFAKRRECGAAQFGAWLLCLVSLLYYFQPNPYDNNKLLCIWYLLCLPCLSWYLEDLWHALSSFPSRGFLALCACLLLFTSGSLSIVREIISGGEFLAFSDDDMEFASYLKENTEPDALFITGRQHLNPTAVLAGRTVYCGSDLYLFFHGIDTTERNAKLTQIYQDAEESRALAEEIGADYIVLSDYERYDYPGSSEILNSQYEELYSSGALTLYRVRKAS